MDDSLIDVTLDYVINDEPVTYTRRLTVEQIGQLLTTVDEMADDNET